MLKRAHDAPRLIRNKLGAYTTDTAYRISTVKIPADRLVYCFMNPLTALSAELEGRHYGGGVLELVPSEIERMLVPTPEGISVDLSALDTAVRSGPISSVMDSFGRGILKEADVAPADIDTLIDAWNRLRNRRQRNSADEEIEEGAG